jgi:hypothetical protein
VSLAEVTAPSRSDVVVAFLSPELLMMRLRRLVICVWARYQQPWSPMSLRPSWVDVYPVVAALDCPTVPEIAKSTPLLRFRCTLHYCLLTQSKFHQLLPVTLAKKLATELTDLVSI